MNTDGIEKDCFAWGKYIRSEPSGWNHINTLERVRLEREGASQTGAGFGPTIPVRFLRKDLQYVHRQYRKYRDSEPALADTMLALFAMPNRNREQRARSLGIGKTQMYDRRGLILRDLALSCPDTDCGQA